MLRLGTLKASCLMSSPALPRVRSGSPESAVAENGTSLRFCSRRVAVTITSSSVSDAAVSAAGVPAARAAAGIRNPVAATAINIPVENSDDRRARQFVVFIPNPSERSCKILRAYSPNTAHVFVPVDHCSRLRRYTTSVAIHCKEIRLPPKSAPQLRSPAFMRRGLLSARLSVHVPAQPLEIGRASSVIEPSNLETVTHQLHNFLHAHAAFLV